MLVGTPCNAVNIARGFYLHPYPYDQNKYVQCETTPGMVYIRTCPTGLVFDDRYSVCNYPIGIVQYWNSYITGVYYGK